jgi:hypothetical protein
MISLEPRRRWLGASCSIAAGGRLVQTANVLLHPARLYVRQGDDAVANEEIDEAAMLIHSFRTPGRGSSEFTGKPEGVRTRARAGRPSRQA